MYDCVGQSRGKRDTKHREKKTSEKRCLCVPLALEGEDGEERMTGFFRLLLGL